MRKVIDWKVLKTLVPYSRQHIARLERACLFPRRVQLGPNRCGWFEDEVADWIDSRPRQHIPDDTPE